MTAVPPAQEPAPSERELPTVLEQMGGIQGVVASTIPVAVFVVVNVVGGLQAALIAAIGAGVAIAIWRIARRQPLQPAVSGLLGVGIAAFIAYRSGEARGFYLPGLVLSSAFALAFLGSVLVRWPLAGVIWQGVNGRGQSWRDDPRLRRAYTWATLMWAAVFVARVVVQGLLYNADEATWLGIARLAMGYPLLAVAVLGSLWVVRRAQRATPQPA